MGRRRSWMTALGMIVCVALIATAALAGEGKGKGEGKERKGLHRAKGQRMRTMGSEALTKEFEQFKATMKACKEEADAFRDKIKKAVQDAHKGDGKPTREMIKEAVGPYRAEAKQIATKIADERIRHNQAVVAILKAERTQMIDRMTKGLLMPRGGPGGGKNLWRKGQGEGPEGRSRGGNVKIQPAGYDVQIDVPE